MGPNIPVKETVPIDMNDMENRIHEVRRTATQRRDRDAAGDCAHDAGAQCGEGSSVRLERPPF